MSLDKCVWLLHATNLHSQEVYECDKDICLILTAALLGKKSQKSLVTFRKWVFIICFYKKCALNLLLIITYFPPWYARTKLVIWHKVCYHIKLKSGRQSLNSKILHQSHPFSKSSTYTHFLLHQKKNPSLMSICFASRIIMSDPSRMLTFSSFFSSHFHRKHISMYPQENERELTKKLYIKAQIWNWRPKMCHISGNPWSINGFSTNVWKKW